MLIVNIKKITITFYIIFIFIPIIGFKLKLIFFINIFIIFIIH